MSGQRSGGLLAAGLGIGAAVGLVAGAAIWSGGRALPAGTSEVLPVAQTGPAQKAEGGQPKVGGDVAAQRQRGAYLWAVGGCND